MTISLPAAATHIECAPTGLRSVIAAQSRTHGLDRLVLWLLSAFAFVLPTDVRLPGDKSVAMRLGLACLLLGSAALLRRRGFVLPRSGFWWLAGFLAWSSCSLLWARYPEIAQHKMSLYFAVFAVTAIIPQYAWTLSVRARLIDSFLLGCGFGISGLIANFALGTQYSASGEAEMEGRYSFGTDPNYLALALVIGIPLALHRSRQLSRGWQRTLTLLYTPAAVLGVFLTGSRGAMVALLVALIAYGVAAGVRSTAVVLAAACLCLVAGALLPGQISERIAGIPEELRYGTLSDRRQLWDRGEAMIAEHPLEGIGVGASSGALNIAVHNTPLELMMEGGAVGTCLFYGALLSALRGTLKSERLEGRTFVAVSSCWFVGALTLSWELNTVTWFIFALLFSASSGSNRAGA